MPSTFKPPKPLSKQQKSARFREAVFDLQSLFKIALHSRAHISLSLRANFTRLADCRKTIKTCPCPTVCSRRSVNKMPTIWLPKQTCNKASS